MTDNRPYFDELVLQLKEAELSQMFGKPCGKIHKKAFVAFFQNKMVFKVGAEEVNLLKQKYNGAKNWDPSGKGRAMKNWIQVPDDFKVDWKTLAAAACAFVEV